MIDRGDGELCIVGHLAHVCIIAHFGHMSSAIYKKRAVVSPYPHRTYDWGPGLPAILAAIGAATHPLIFQHP